MNELKDLEVEEVSLVDEGSNPDANILLYKRKEPKDMVDKNNQPAVDTDKEQLQKRVAELEKELADRDAADKEAIDKAAKEQLDAANAQANALLERLTKKLDEHIEKAETAELMKVAEKYEILGEKPDELCTVLKSVKGTDAYDKIVGLFDKSLAAVEKAGTFTELGKKGFGSQSADVEKVADEIQKADPSISRRWALDQAYQRTNKIKE
ncbi:MAG: hypothetical protein II968_03750 [Selenomonadaceae bacterium]|nr:hypothetical protein [Selenomonadaceae bacterium]